MQNKRILTDDPVADALYRRRSNWLLLVLAIAALVILAAAVWPDTVVIVR